MHWRLLLMRQAMMLVSFLIFGEFSFLPELASYSQRPFNLGSTGGFFDFDGSLFLNNTFPPGIPGVEPVLGAMIGLSAGEITYPTAGGQPLGHPTTLTFTFLPNSFIAGDLFRFSADVDGGGSSGGTFGSLGASFSVLMSSGETFSAPFVRLSDNQSEATIAVSDEEAVPTPPTLPLFATGLGLMALLAWRKRRRQRSF
jgi:hypothetical protein